MNDPDHKTPDKKTPLQRVGDFLFGAEQADSARAHKSRVASSAPITGVVQQSAAPIPARMQAGTLQLVGLDHIRATLGTQWELWRDEIQAIVENVFRRYLEPVDPYYRIDDERFLVLFTRLTHQQSEAKAEAMAREIERLILGERPGCDITIKSRVAEVDHSLLTEKVQTLDELLRYVESGAFAEEMQDLLSFDEVGDAQAAAGVDPGRVGPGPDLTDLDQSLAGLFQKISPAAYLKECSIRFDPVFNVRRRMFTAFLVTPLFRGEPALGDDDPLVDNPEELRFHLDRYALLSAALGLQPMLQQNPDGIMVIPVHCETLTVGQTRNTYLQRLREVPAGLYKHLAFSVVGVPSGTPSGRIADIISYLQPVSVRQSVRVSPDPRLIDLYRSAGCHAFSTSATAFAEQSIKQVETMALFARRARTGQIEGVLYDIDDKDMLHLAVATGFTLLIGAAVAPGLIQPGALAGIGKSHILGLIDSAT
ncbi:hypothetical protein [Ferrovibrio sp.]|uniref:hypothetical protein n=1 Tax=Ferrovibrio sp. TaxID=1917215 RepID=UPI0026252634|nr:hypothetical protein [Ferrovibrio sp.]